jgi:NADH dehydrogenase
MSCASAGYTSKQATGAILGYLTGRDVAITKLPYVGNHISLGRDDAIFQLVDGDGRAKPGALLGRPAARVKGAILRTAGWASGHPTFGMPSRKHHLAPAIERVTQALAA